MIFLDRREELERLNNLLRRREGGLALVYGRRRLGKTRLLLEWCKAHRGIYSVADQSAANIQRRYFAAAVAESLPGFADVEYPDWRSLLTRLTGDAAQRGFRGPVVMDEFPYLVVSSPDLPSVLQMIVDSAALRAGLVFAIAGSSQRMMQGLVLDRNAPLYGRAREVLEVRPLAPGFLRSALKPGSIAVLLEHHAAWGGVPRYWELAEAARGSPSNRVLDLVLDPLGPLHREPDRLLLEEIPSAFEVRPVLDAIGSGAHKVSEIAGRLGRPATSMSRPLERLVELGLARREVPFGESEQQTRRSLYRIEDAFFRLWFRVVAPHRGMLAVGTRAMRAKLLERLWHGLVAEAWEDLCRTRLPLLVPSSVNELGQFASGLRWWRGNAAEWDVVSTSLEGKNLLLGEAKWSRRPLTKNELVREARSLAIRVRPDLPGAYAKYREVRVLFVPEIAKGCPRRLEDVLVATGDQIVGTDGT